MFARSTIMLWQRTLRFLTPWTRRPSDSRRLVSSTDKIIPNVDGFVGVSVIRSLRHATSRYHDKVIIKPSIIMNITTMILKVLFLVRPRERSSRAHRGAVI